MASSNSLETIAILLANWCQCNGGFEHLRLMFNAMIIASMHGNDN